MKKLKLVVIFGIILMLILITPRLAMAIDINQKINTNVYVNDIDLSKLTKSQAKKKINDYLDSYRYFTLINDQRTINVDKNKFDVNYKVDDLVDKAFNVGRDKDIISNIKTNLSLRKGNKKVINIKCEYNKEKIDKYIDDLNKDIYIEPINATAQIINKQVIVKKGSYGKSIDTQKLKEIIYEKIDKIENDESDIPIKPLKPKYTYDQLSKIDTVLGSYETKFNPKNTKRVNNIKVASKYTSNVLLDKGEKLFFNSFLQHDYVKKELQEAPIIKDGKHDKGLGGGICQVSSTLYNAALYAGMDIKKVQNHSIPSIYVEKGRDATISDGYIDFVFENPYDTPVIIYNEVINDKIVSTIYGSQNDKKDIEIITKVQAVIKNKEIVKKDPKLTKDVKIVEEEGRLGYTVNTFRVYKKNDEILKKELIYTSYYPPSDKIVVEGTKPIVLEENPNEILK